MNTFDKPVKNPSLDEAFKEASLTISHILHSNGEYLGDRIYWHNAQDRRNALDKAARTVTKQREEAVEVLESLLEFWDNGTPIHSGADIVSGVRNLLAQFKA
jgi:hypothetical protein